MNQPAKRPSYRDIPPREYGGENARNGMAFQDHVTAQYCLEMMLGSDILEVWCETLDDVTIVRQIDSGELFEFVQVKSNDLGAFWSVAKLCERENFTDKDGKRKKRPGSSILEKSLDSSIGEQECRFKMVTSCPIDKKLRLLTYPLTSPDRDTGGAKYAELVKEVSSYVGDYKLENGNDHHFWISRATWHVVHSEEYVQSTNLLLLEELLEKISEQMFVDQRKELYSQLVGMIFEAARARYNIDPAQKRITKDDCLNWLRSTIFRTKNPGFLGSGTRLTSKLIEGGLESYIEDAQSQRRTYLTKRRTASFLATFDKDTVESDADYAFTRLKIALDTGNLDSGPGFLDECLKELEDVCAQANVKQSGVKSYLAGYMYDLADRCVFRFRKAGV